MYTDEEYAKSHVGWGHSTWQEGLRLCKSAGALVAREGLTFVP